MRFSKLTTTLKALSPAQKKRLHLYLQSPYFEHPEAPVALYGYLTGLHKAYSEKHLTEEAISSQCPTLATPAIQNKAGTQLLTAIHRFLALEHWQQQPHQPALCGIQGLKNIHLFDEAQKQIAELKETLHQAPEYRIGDLEALHRLTEIEQTGMDARTNRQALDRVTEIIHTLDRFYALKKIRYLCEIANRENWTPMPHTEAHTAQLLHILQPLATPQHAYVYIFLNIYHMLQPGPIDQPSAAYLHIKEYLSSLHTLNTTATEAVAYLQNYILRAGTSGAPWAPAEYLWCIALRQQHHTLLDNGCLHPTTFRNTLTMALKAHQNPGWIQQFYDTYQPLLPAHTSPHYTQLGMGICHYAHRQYETAAYHFALAKSGTEHASKATARRYYIQCIYHYWKNKTDIEPELDSFYQYLLHHKTQIPKAYHNYTRFISAMRRLIRTTTRKERQQLHTELLPQPYFAGKEWIEQQLTTP